MEEILVEFPKEHFIFSGINRGKRLDYIVGKSNVAIFGLLKLKLGFQKSNAALINILCL
jgi:hypothetical protein